MNSLIITREHAYNSVFPGWYQFIDDLYDIINDWNNVNNTKISVIGIKSKWGRLIVSLTHKTTKDSYLDCAKIINDICSDISVESSKTCEICGENGKFTEIDDGFYYAYILCDEHSRIKKHIRDIISDY